ncbi:MAG: metallophosphatase [Oscillatoriales cyanobacterium SM2_2_1]|nr:metallophosphatase [Oscillatoriales cyanobacterium SM2_2_1]
MWALLCGLGGDGALYEAILADVHRQPAIRALYILGNVIGPNARSNDLVQRLQAPHAPGPQPQVCLGWWEQQCLILHGLSQETEPHDLIEHYGVGTAKLLWDEITRETIAWIYQLPLAFNEYDCLLLHGSTVAVGERLDPKADPFFLLDRITRAGANRLFCGRSGQAFRYDITAGTVTSRTITLNDTQETQGDSPSERAIIGVGSGSTYALYDPLTDALTFRTVPNPAKI